MTEALIGFIGVVIGSLLTLSKDVWLAAVERRRNGNLAAIQIIMVLDRFVETCVDIVQDDGTVDGQLPRRTKDGQAYAEPQIDRPDELKFPTDLDWKSVGADEMYRALSLQSALHEGNRFISFQAEHASPPDFHEFFQARHQVYAELGMEASAVAEVLRCKFDLPERSRPSWNPEWSHSEFLADRLKALS